jgi:hypothetical protein
MTKLLVQGAIVVALASASHAAIIFDKMGTPGSPGYNMTDFENDDDFTFSASHTIAAVRFWATDPSLPQTGAIFYKFYDNGASGAPGNLLGSGSATATITPTGNPSEYVFAINLASPVTLGVGTFYLALHEGPFQTSDGTQIFWESSGPGLHFQLANALTPPPTEPQTSNELAFQLFDTPFTSVPEPGSAALLAGAMLAALTSKIRR